MAPDRLDARIPVSLLTGFLGSGKTTLLGRLVRCPDMADTAVIINEFGEIGLDHQLVEMVEGEAVLLASGCLCCTMRDDLAATLCELDAKRRRGDVPAFRRVVVETTGLADPAPILHSLLRDPRVRRAYRVDGVITTVDAVNGGAQLDRQPESVKQAAMADRLVLTKRDLADGAAVEQLARRLAHLNPGARLVVADRGVVDPALVFDIPLLPAKVAASAMDGGEGGRYLGDMPRHICGPGCNHPPGLRHDADIRTYAFRFDEPLDWACVSDWLGGLAYFHGPALLRVKGVLNVRGEAAPVAVHAVQHLFHEPVSLAGWPDDDRASRIVFITRGLDRAVIAAAWDAALAA
ncbi:MAG: GTP-binding protein [Pigmentiphaga sp.]|uniref:CobW family GTP-binding protein n=1 Tax=Pigmentiphaga sp. TaxID=1977564 RepID=UPI0029B873A8|nr:GTP-binding protein [Pigmentiphaga sp.]MDX3904951.1 GTP-binding protein [Pigmentiphaga sp.]